MSNQVRPKRVHRTTIDGHGRTASYNGVRAALGELIPGDPIALWLYKNGVLQPDSIGESSITLTTGTTADLANASWAFPSTAVTLQADTDLGGDMFFDSAAAMAPIVRYGYEWYALLNKTYAWIGFHPSRGGIAIYSTSQAANAAKIQNYLGTILQPGLTGLIGRYKASIVGLADGAAMSSWPDISGLRNHAIQETGANQPFYRTNVVGQPSAQFRGNQSLSLPAAITASTRNCSMFFISRRNLGPDNQELYGAIGTGTEWMYKLYDAPYQNYTGVLSSGDKRSTIILPSQLALHGVASFADRIRAFCNDTAENVTGAPQNLTPTGGWIGSAYTRGTYSISADVCEVFIYDHAISDDEYAVLKAYAYAEYGIIHQHTSQVVFVGNSMTGGYGVLDHQTYPLIAAALLPSTAKIINQGRNSRTTPQMITDAATAITPIYNAAYAKNILVVWEGRNDLVANLASKEDALANLQTYCAARKAEGWIVIAMTILPSGPGSAVDFEGSRQWISDQMVAGFVSGGHADVVVDIRANATIGQSGQNNNITYYTDSVHLTAAGNTIVAGEVATAVNALLAA